MKTQLISLSVMAFAGAMFLSSFNKAEPPKKTKLADDALIKKGEYLVGILGCGDCHAPKMMTSHGLSGHPSAIPMPKVNKEALKDWALFFPTLTMSVGPWGASFAANITPDATGIGSWTYEQFKIAMTQGKSKGIATARPLLPPMPWQNYVNMKDEDLRAVFAYLKSCKPIHNVIPQPISPDKL